MKKKIMKKKTQKKNQEKHYKIKNQGFLSKQKKAYEEL